MITEKEMLNIKEEAQGIRDQIISAKATYNEVLNNIANHEKTLKECGVTDPSKVDDTLAKIEEDIQKECDSAKQIIANYKSAIN